MIKSKEMKLLAPEVFYNIEDIVEILQERETSILVNLKSYTEGESISKIMGFINSCQTSYACLRLKKINNKCFICWSEHTL